MSDKEKMQLNLIDGQLLGCLLYIVALVIAVIIVVETRNKFLKRKRFFSDLELERLVIVNRIFILLLVLFFLYLSYEGYVLVRDSGEDTRNLSYQVFASFLAVVVALIGLYIVYQGENTGKIVLPDIENLFI